MTKRRILIHLGYPKTGSTSIQQFLNKIENKDLAKFLPGINNKNNNIIDNKFRIIHNEIFFDKNVIYKKKKWLKFYDLNLKKYNILSDESFLYPTNYKMVNFQRTLKRYLEIFYCLNCKIDILIFIRDPKILHISYFTDMHHRIRQYSNEINTFEKYISSINNNKIINHIFKMFNFNRTVNIIQKLDKKFIINKNLNIMTLENIQEFKNYFFNFCKILNLRKDYKNLIIQKKNSTKKVKEVYIRNYDVFIFLFQFGLENKLKYGVKKILKRSKILNFLLGFKKIKSHYTNELINKINNYYKKDLRKFEQKTNLNLKKYYEY